jgi:hypothetical protein
MDWLKAIAPTIATAIGGPFGTMAYSIIANTMGISAEDAKKTVESGKLTADQIASVQQAEIALKAKAQELGLNFEQLAVEDKKSAREMQVATKSWVPPVLAIAVTLGFFTILISLMLGKVEHGPAIDIMLGSLGAAWTGIISFYFGSSAGSQKKDEMIHNSTPTK